MLGPHRRGLLQLGAVLALTASRARGAQPPPAATPRPAVPDSAILLMPGPEGSPAARWAETLAAGLLRGLPHAVSLRATALGGPDGITAANRFATLEAGNGRTLLVLPGVAAHLRLVGESRAQFTPDGWLPICVSWQGAVLAGKGSWPRPRTAMLRLALPAPEAPETAALLALDLMGVEAQPVFATALQPPEDLVARGHADALVIGAPAPLRVADALGLSPWLELETPGRRDHPQLPSTAAVPGAAARLEAMQAGFAALRLRAALMLPELTPADTVAAWRHAALRWQEEEARQSTEPAAALVGAEARATIAPLFPPPPAMLAYREWLLRRLSWQPA
ncbi:hypothetical protein [Teichococcus oryzae]|uniref:Tripartite tricarboxylate transporter substrate binding protein n=1 Tax=Teichococcus oryzae TaxID=1608942 RepID=A0A5B2TGK0_9PROT|nr:hypothetical protein [Pseudoroseomonas oryzae]KAA2213115.1 hypothetical protein F0Q34_10780 [Pseudoroseomonas oryzae]